MRWRWGRSVLMHLAMTSPSRYSSRDVCGGAICWPPSDIWRLHWPSCWRLNSQSCVRKPTNDRRLSRTGISSNNLSSRTNNLSPRTNNLSTRTNNLSPRTNNLSPRTNNLSPRTNNSHTQTTTHKTMTWSRRVEYTYVPIYSQAMAKLNIIVFPEIKVYL